MGEERKERPNARLDREPMKRFALRLPEPLYEKVAEEHWDQRKSMNQVIVDILEAHYQ